MEDLSFDCALDYIALAIFFVCWFGYSLIADHNFVKSKNLVKITHAYRIRWMKNMIRRPDRLVDIRIIGNLISSTTFLASTSILIIAGLVAVLGFGFKGVEILNSISFVVVTSIKMWVVKSVFVLMIFVYSFYKFTWVMRQFNYASVILMSAPVYIKGESTLRDIKRAVKYIHRLSFMLSNAGRHFNIAVRSYYFGLAALSWFINPALLIIVSILVAIVLYRREFMSKTLDILS